jgi:D-alanyl-lipoteichoic acid biosynthesis protein DltD
MKKLIILYILPFIVALIVVYFIALNKQANYFLFKKKEVIDNNFKQDTCYINNFSENPAFEDQFLKSGDSNEIIYLLGSSELTNPTVAIPYNFISQHFTTKVFGVGHAGNQCLSIYSQLLANEERLENAPIVIILSPGWFESTASEGTSSSIFLEYNSKRFLNKIINDKNDSDLNAYLNMRISQFYEEFSSPNLELRIMNFKYLANQSILHRAAYAPLIFCDNVLISLRDNNFSQIKSNNKSFKRNPIITESVPINWDSLYAVSRGNVIKKSTNNSMGIDNDYYIKNINGKIGHTKSVDKKLNIELDDCIMLIKLLKEKKANASFVISPLNPFYYRNLKDISPTISVIENEIKNSGFQYLNLLETDSTKYDKALLNDIMHLSDYGWYKIDHFIIDTYHLNK